VRINTHIRISILLCWYRLYGFCKLLFLNILCLVLWKVVNFSFVAVNIFRCNIYVAPSPLLGYVSFVLWVRISTSRVVRGNVCM
jgi:hypothetical protein